MGYRLTLHFVDKETRSRAEGARLAFSLGHHAEVYADLSELIQRPPHEGIVLARDDCTVGGVMGLLADLERAGISLPLIVVAREPQVPQVVAAIKAGALDFMELPLERDQLNEVLGRVSREAKVHIESRRRMFEARAKIDALSPREREVLDWLADGCSNKAIARELEISPRTVEIHRANMMEKLGAHHAADAIRVRLEAHIDEFPPPTFPAPIMRRA